MENMDLRLKRLKDYLELRGTLVLAHKNHIVTDELAYIIPNDSLKKYNITKEGFYLHELDDAGECYEVFRIEDIEAIEIFESVTA